MIVVFGSVALDLVTNVSRIPSPGESLACPDYALVPGSKGGNQALAAARSGAKVVHVATVGRDEHAELATALLKAEGVDLSHLARSDRMTGLCLVTVAADGENTVIAAAGANLDTRVAQLEALEFGEGDTLVFQMEVALPENFAAVVLARRRGARTVLNAAPAQRVPEETLRVLDVLVVNEHEAMIVAEAVGLSVSGPTEAAEGLHRTYGCSAIVTLGSKGAQAWHEGILLEIPAPKIVPVDTTSAGDSFVGAFAAALDGGSDFPTAVRRGVVAGSLACTLPGAQTSIPRLADILSFSTDF
ncbi:ribokinase [Shinella sp. PSBB067]|uniref:ribokinase n=1 Tax=unclassified Shinella TaxID=2643062 RepID=UPI00193B06D2|nr:MULTISPECIES: ribokinase [unclassified Shinella]QRI63828.1 ribokinase [Shinella sp. PSBB067]